LFVITTGSASAGGIKTQRADIVLQLGDNGDQPLELPSDVAVHAGKIYVVDGSHHRIMVYDLQGQFLFQFGSKGKQPGQLNYPLGIDVSTDNRVYITDSGNHRIQIFSDKGVFLSGFTLKEDKKGTKKELRPIDIIRHSRTGNIIVSASNHRLMIYSPKGKLLKKWGNNGMNQGEFRYPATISELKDGRIAVVDVLNSRAQVFNMDGSISLVVGEWGVLPGQLFRPKGIAIDRKGNFYISDSYMNVVQKYSDEGIFVAVLGNKGIPYDMLTPVGMTVHKNRLYIVEMKKHRVSVYQLEK
jgi:DNA-binding beta-propeller fold protein YncE